MRTRADKGGHRAFNHVICSEFFLPVLPILPNLPPLSPPKHARAQPLVGVSYGTENQNFSLSSSTTSSSLPTTSSSLPTVINPSTMHNPGWYQDLGEAEKKIIRQKQEERDAEKKIIRQKLKARLEQAKLHLADSKKKRESAKRQGRRRVTISDELKARIDNTDSRYRQAKASYEEALMNFNMNMNGNNGNPMGNTNITVPVFEISEEELNKLPVEKKIAYQQLLASQQNESKALEEEAEKMDLLHAFQVEQNEQHKESITQRRISVQETEFRHQESWHNFAGMASPSLRPRATPSSAIRSIQSPFARKMGARTDPSNFSSPVSKIGFGGGLTSPPVAAAATGGSLKSSAKFQVGQPVHCAQFGGYNKALTVESFVESSGSIYYKLKEAGNLIAEASLSPYRVLLGAAEGTLMLTECGTNNKEFQSLMDSGETVTTTEPHLLTVEYYKCQFRGWKRKIHEVIQTPAPMGSLEHEENVRSHIQQLCDEAGALCDRVADIKPHLRDNASDQLTKVAEAFSTRVLQDLEESVKLYHVNTGNAEEQKKIQEACKFRADAFENLAKYCRAEQQDRNKLLHLKHQCGLAV